MPRTKKVKPVETEEIKATEETTQETIEASEPQNLVLHGGQMKEDPTKRGVVIR